MQISMPRAGASASVRRDSKVAYLQPQVSIALCTYNGEKFLREQLDSLLTQTGCELDIVAVDDASTDASPAILQEYAQRERRLHVYINAANCGPIENFRRALALCSGEFICPCDQDDIWDPGKTRALLDALGDADLVYCDSRMIDAEGRPLGQKLSDSRVMYQGREPLALLLHNCVSGHASLFRQDLLQRALPFPEQLYHDWWLAIAAACGRGIRYLPEALVAFRRHAGTVTRLGKVRGKDPRQQLRTQLQQQQIRLRGMLCFADPGQTELQALDDAMTDWLDHGRGLRYNLLLWRHRRLVHAIRKAGRGRSLAIAAKQLRALWRGAN